MKARNGAVAIIAILLVVPMTVGLLLNAIITVGLPPCSTSPFTPCFAGAEGRSLLGEVVNDDPLTFAGATLALLLLFWLVVVLAWKAGLTKPPRGRQLRNAAITLLTALLVLVLF